MDKIQYFTVENVINVHIIRSFSFKTVYLEHMSLLIKGV